MRNSRVQLILALGLGLVAAFLVWNYSVQLQEQAQLARQQQPLPPTPVIVTTDVLVAAQDIPSRTLLTAELLKVVQVPVESKIPEALTKVEDAAGKISQVPLAAGEQVLPSKFAADKSTQTFAYSIPEGKRAVAITVSDIIAAGGLVVPGDHVDIIVSYGQQGSLAGLATTLVQNVEVLAVAQSIDRALPAQAVTPIPKTATVTVTPPAAAATAAPSLQKTLENPGAHTMTLALTPEQAEQVILAGQHGQLTLALRRFGDNAVVDIPDVKVTPIPGSEPPTPTVAASSSPVATPVSTAAPVEVTDISIAPTSLHPGDLLRVQITVKNVSDRVIQSQGPDPQYTYVQGQTYYSQNFPSSPGKFRVGINFEGHSPAPYPYRWGLGGDLLPGASTTVIGLVKMTYDVTTTTFFAGVIEEPEKLVLDQQGRTLVTVLPANVAVVVVHDVHVRSGPDTASSIIDTIDYGTQVPILGQVNDWYKIKLPDGREGYVAAGWIVAVSGQQGSTPQPTPVQTSVPSRTPKASAKPGP